MSELGKKDSVDRMADVALNAIDKLEKENADLRGKLEDVKSGSKLIKAYSDRLKQIDELAGQIIELQDERDELFSKAKQLESQVAEWQRKSNFYAKQVGDSKVSLDEQIECRNEAQGQVAVMRWALEESIEKIISEYVSVKPIMTTFDTGICEGLLFALKRLEKAGFLCCDDNQFVITLDAAPSKSK